MSYTFATYFDDEIWEKNGVNWCRKTKSVGLYGFVMHRNLSEDAINKIEELGFSATKINSDHNDDRDLFLTIIDTIKRDQRCLFVRPEIIPSVNLPESQELVCRKDSNLNLFQLATAINNLHQRSKAINKIREKHGGEYLTCSHVLGTWNFWVKYYGFQNILSDKKTLKYFDSDLTLNLFLSLNNSISFEIEKDAIST